MGLEVERSDGTRVRTGDELALMWWLKGAEGNHCAAVRRMVKVYQEGELGMSVDTAEAAEWQARTETCHKNYPGLLWGARYIECPSCARPETSSMALMDTHENAVIVFDDSESVLTS
jgi:hypothetical protein